MKRYVTVAEHVKDDRGQTLFVASNTDEALTVALLLNNAFQSGSLAASAEAATAQFKSNVSDAGRCIACGKL